MKLSEIEIRNNEFEEEETLSLVEEPQISIFDDPDNLTLDPEKSIWDKSVKVEENGYYWHKEPLILKGQPIKNDKPIVVELFRGCGGTSLGFEMAGYQIAIGCDIHQPSITTFKNNHSNVSAVLGDVKNVNPNSFLELLDGR